MNKQRREQIAEAIGKIEEAVSILETVSSEEREYYDNMPESLQGGDKGQQADETAMALEDALQSCEEARDKLTEIGA